MENIEVNESPAVNGEPELTIVEGAILERSALPDPEKSDYPDCRFTCHFKGNSIVKGKPCPQELSLILEGFADRKLLGTKDLKPGDRVICIALPFDKLPQTRQTTQQADDLNLFSLANYYAIDVRNINEFSDLPGTPSSGIAFTGASDKPYVSVFERHVNPPIKEEFKKAQQEAIAQELQQIEAMLAPYTPARIAELQKSFATAWEAEKVKDPPGYNRVVRKGKDGKDKEYVWRNVENSFWALPVDYRLPDYKEDPITPYNLEALIALRDFLEANGCQLLISPIPDFQEIAARVINQEFRTMPNFQTAYMARQLLKHGIETFYPSKTLIDNCHRYPWAFFYPDDSHPSDTTQDIMTDIVAKKLSRYHFHETLNSRYFSIEPTPHYYGNNRKFWLPSKCDIGDNKPDTSYYCRQVLYKGEILVSDNQSPIVVIGNSYIWLPIRDSFSIILQSKINIAVQRHEISSFGPVTGIVQQLFASPETLLSHKTIIVLVMGTRWFCAPTIFNNIRLMDNHAKNISGKKNVKTYAIRSNMAINDNKSESLRRSIVRPNFIEISTNESMPLVNAVIDGIDNHKSTIIVIPTYLHAWESAKYLINGQEVTIPRSYGTYHHVDVFYELPAGTDRLKVELVGKPGTILSICNIQVYQ